jgi:hypothetical protein
MLSTALLPILPMPNPAPSITIPAPIAAPRLLGRPVAAGVAAPWAKAGVAVNTSTATHIAAILTNEFTDSVSYRI